MTAPPRPEVTPLTEPYWQSLADGTLSFQRCGDCGNAWLPARSECPRCLAANWSWEPSAGNGKLVSWVVYHTAYHPYFEDKLPYPVAVIELDEGPRLIAALADPPERLAVDRRMRLAVRHVDDMHLATFHVVS